MTRFINGIIVGAIAGAVIGVTLDPVSSRDRRMVRRKVGRLLRSFR